MTITVTQTDQKFNQLTAQLKAAVSEYEQARLLHIEVTVRWEEAKAELETTRAALVNGLAEFMGGKKE